MKKKLAIFVTFLLVNFLQAQIEYEGSPIALSNVKYFKEVPVFTTPITNIEALRIEDRTIDKIKDIPWRYGYIHYVDVSFEKGVYDYLPNGDRIWRIKIVSANAQTLNITFDKYKLEPGAKLFLYNQYNTLGAFTHKNNKDHGYLTTTLIEGEELTIELFEPQSTIGKNQLHLERVVNGYRTLDYRKTLKGIGTSGNCNNNVICSVGDDWRDQIRSVGILLSQNNYTAYFCSGALINNTCIDGKPYFLTANHCSAGPTSVVGFNYESLDCNTNNWAGDNHTISGATVKATNPGSDVALLELSSVPPVNYNVFYAGWDHSDNFPTMQVGIHHPDGDLKKISFDNDPATQSISSNAQCWRIGNWEDGTTEPGSSGSPLFNQDGNIIGQLFNGSAACGNTLSDYYGRFDVSWDNGSGPTDELQSWLDSCNTGVEVLNGYDPNAIVLDTDAYIRFINKPNGEYCGEKLPQVIQLRNRGTQNLTNVEFVYGVAPNFNVYTWQGTLASNQTENIVLDSLDLPNGNYNYEAYLTLVNGVQDQDQSNDSINFNFDLELGIDVTIDITTNYSGNENYFTITNGNDTIAAEGPFGQRQTYSYKYCLPNGEYCVNMYDDGGNGLSPTFFNIDPGNFKLTVDFVEIFNGDTIGTAYNYCFEKGVGTGIKENKVFNDFILYPNPNNGVFTVKSTQLINKIEVLSVLGSVVYHQQINDAIYQIQLNNLSQGLYFVKVFTNKGTGLQRIIVK